MGKPLNIGIAGLGTIGGGTFKLLTEQADIIESRAGRAVRLVAVADPDALRMKEAGKNGIKCYADALPMAADEDVDVVIELIGGSEGIAKKLCEAAIKNAKHVVTANKALVAHHGSELAGAAEDAGVSFAYEAAVAGGIPIIKSLREGLAGNRLTRVYGILNGTCNYILSAMAEGGREFDDVLKECQELGYAEADPSFDIDGIDTAHKLAILASVAFGGKVNFGAVHTEGIRHVSLTDMKFADELGYTIKLLGVASVRDDGLEQRVHPCMVPSSSPIATVAGSLNAVVAEGDFVDTTVHEGYGAGAGPTASAVAADVIDIARGLQIPTFGIPAVQLKTISPVPMERHVGAYYVRLMLVDKPGVFADIASALKDHKVSMESVLQRTRDPGEAVPVVMTLHETEEAGVLDALAEIEAIDAVVEQPRMIRIENL